MRVLTLPLPGPPRHGERWKGCCTGSVRGEGGLTRPGLSGEHCTFINTLNTRS